MGKREKLTALVVSFLVFWNISASALAEIANTTDKYIEIEQENQLLPEKSIIMNETFEDYPTGSVDCSFEIDGGVGKIVNLTASDKGYCLIPSKSYTYIRKSGVDFSESTMIGIDIKNAETSSHFSLGIAAASKHILKLVTVENRRLTDVNGTIIGGIGSNEKTVSLAVRFHNFRFYDVYLNGDCIKRNIQIKGELAEGDIVFARFSQEKELIIDNFRAYKSNVLRDDFPTKTYNFLEYDGVYVNNDNGDYTYLDSNNLDNNTGTYNNVVYAPSGNIIEATRLDYMNPDRKTGYIHMKKTNKNACYFEYRVNRVNSIRDNSNQKSMRTFNYFLIECDVKFDTFAPITILPQIYDTNVSVGANISQSLATFKPGGTILFSDGTVAANVVDKGKWFNYKIALNLIDHTADFYVDDELIYEGMKLDKNLFEFTRARFQMSSGSTQGDMYIDKLNITGLVNPYKKGKGEPVNIFSDESAERAFLSDKTAFSTLSNIVFANNEKYMMDTFPIFKDDTLYIEIGELKKAFPNDIEKINSYTKTIENEGKTFIPVMEFAQTALGKNVFYHAESGLVIVSDKKLNFDDEDWIYPSQRPSTKMTVLNDIDFLSWFMTYERPTGEQIKEDTLKTIGSLDVHPRVMLTQERIDEFKELMKTDDDFNKIATRFIAQADNLMKKALPTYKYDDPLRLSTDMTTVPTLALAYNLTGDKKYLDRCYEQLVAILQFPDYNEATLINSSAWLIMLSIGYDWLYNGLTNKQRAYIEDKTYNGPFIKMAKGFYGRIRGRADSGDFANYKWVSNIDVVSVAGTLVAAAAFTKIDPDYCFDIMSKSLLSYEYPVALVAPNGGWAEGMSYWNYAFRHFNYGLLTTKAMCGSYYGIDNAKGFKQMADYLNAMTGTNGLNACGDISTATIKSYAAYMGTSRILGNDTLQQVRLIDILPGSTPSWEDIIGYTVYENSVQRKVSNITHVAGDELVTIRKDLDVNGENLYFSTHFGRSGGYHLHNDTGTFVFDILGERWAEDFGKDDYNLQNQLGYEGWQLYRKRAEGHNVIVINPPSDKMEQNENCYIDVEKYEANENGGYVTADLTSLYEDAQKVKLGYYIGDNMRSVTTRYEMNVEDNSQMYWFMHTKADIQIDGNKAYLSKNGKSIFLTFDVEGNANAELSVMDAQPLPSSPQVPEQDKNVGYRKIAIKLNGSGDVNLTVKMAPMGEGISMNVDNTPIENWKLPDAVNNLNWSKDITVEVYADEELIANTVPVYNEEIPDIEVKISDVNCAVEIYQQQNIDGYVYIKVYSPDRSDYKMYIYKYEKQKGESIRKYHQIPVKFVEVSSEPQAELGNGKNNMIDNNFETRWTCMAIGESAVFDLGDIKTIDSVALAFWKGSTRSYYYDIHISTDGKKYIPVYSGESSKIEDKSYNIVSFEPAQVRYIKLIANGNSENSSSRVNCNVLEFKALLKK